jgi:DNA-binding SARP family transcriptional activator
MCALEVRVLGPVQITVDGVPVPLRGRTERALVVAMVLSLNHAVSGEHLALALWGDEPPASARNTLQSALSRLRRKFRGALTSDGHSYCLRLDPECVDAVCFETLVVAAADAVAANASRAAELAAAALDLWRGPPFDDLADDDFVVPEAMRLEELRLAAIELHLEADVVLGRLAQAIPRLRAEVTEQPYRERLWYLLMLALARDGRRVEALRAYLELWSVMREVGLEPSRALRELEARIIQESPDVALRLAYSIQAHPSDVHGGV